MCHVLSPFPDRTGYIGLQPPLHASRNFTMTRSFSLLLLLLFALSAGAERHGIDQVVLDGAAKELKTQVAKGNIIGAAYMVYRNGKVVQFNVVGASDVESKTPLKSDSIMRIYSMSKPITSVAAMTLWEKGKFKLDDPVSKFIKSFKHTKVLVTTGGKSSIVPAKRQLTVRDVFRHTTGYSYGDGKIEPYYKKVGMRYLAPKGMFPPKMTILEAADVLANIPALHQPGAKFTYGFNTDLLGRLIEVWSGQTLDKYMASTVFTPLEMVDTGFVVPAGKRNRFTTCHTREGKKIIAVDKAASSPFTRGFKFLSGGGGLVSTMKDYGRFCQMMVSDGRYKSRQILRAGTFKLMFSDQLAKNGKRGRFRFGLGFAIRDVEIRGGKKVKAYYWGGYANTGFEIVPATGVYQVFMRQLVPSTHKVSKALFKMVNKEVSP